VKNLQNFDGFLNEEAPVNSQPSPPDDGGKLGFLGRWAKQLLGIPNTVPAKFNVDNYPEWKKIKDALIPTGKFGLTRSINQPSFTYNNVSDDWSSETLYGKYTKEYFIIEFPAHETEGSDPDFSKVNFTNFASSARYETMSIKNPDAIIAKAKKEIGK
jgi:hypothetical protein